MSFREHLARAAGLVRHAGPVSSRLQAAGLLKAHDGRPVLLERVAGSRFAAAGNLYATKEAVADYFGVAAAELIPRMLAAIEAPSDPEVVDRAPCQEETFDRVDLDRLPILLHCAQDGGRYVSAGVVIAADPRHGQNADFHRMMQLSPQRLSVRVVKGRHFHTFLSHQRRMPMAVCLGNGANVMLAAATSVALGQDELRIANALRPLRVCRARTFDALIPADCEFVLEGTVDLEDRAAEGPFVDLTGTYDTVRVEPVFTVTTITHRRDAVWQALLPGGLEHKVMMGMPREPTIFRAVQRAGVRCLDVNVCPGGCSWLHAVVQIDKRSGDDGPRALAAAFAGHSSLKHAYVVDADVDLYDPLDVEWAMATRFQGDRDLHPQGRAPGSSLDPSGEPGTHLTYKLGFDLTAPVGEGGRAYRRAAYPPPAPPPDEDGAP